MQHTPLCTPHHSAVHSTPSPGHNIPLLYAPYPSAFHPTPLPMTLIPTLRTPSPETSGSSIDAGYGCGGWEGRAEGLLHCEGQGAVGRIGLRGYVGGGKANAERMGPKARCDAVRDRVPRPAAGQGMDV
ncbi:hypothetical protein K439DRAFT_1622103 [Ramaria rubella]|nr:hypothetical protein K439DRAFT_1622103 [Ramaria rubella]